jgi:hypothetical protein
MTHSKKPSLGTSLLLAITVALDAAGTLLLSGGMKHVGGIDAATLPIVVRAFGRAMARAEIWLGIASLIVWFVCSLVLFSRIDFSYVQPVSAIGYALVAVLGYVAGVSLIGRTPSRTTA